ncbi:hypothetical protein LTR84_000664 [Exophiala bonariae]|uniref:Peptidase S8/S53 domain-containing protein n=1 Tax=Exophiala bonariae TaxID=1690606 RepID=A0AAV9NV81_9EURO|nr:hypothetical protein LTR84_000664 [Exophiala bonariae]
MQGSHRLGYFTGSPVIYERSSTPSLALHAISNCGRPGDYNWGLQYHRPYEKGRDVVVYVMEENYSSEDFHLANRLRFLSTTVKGSVDKKRAQLNPSQVLGGHGAQIISLLGGETYGAAQCCKIVVVDRPNEQHDKDYTWELALDVVAQDFTEKKRGNPGLHGVMNISRGFPNNPKCRRALGHILNAGVVVVGAAGNKQIDFDQLPVTDRELWQLPEGFDDRVIIIGSLDDNGRKSSFSNYGRTTAIASGVIACMLGAGQADYDDEITMRDKAICKRVRARLDEWSPVDASTGLKHLKNAPGLTLISPPPPVGAPEPAMIKLTLDDQITNVRDALTRKQKSSTAVKGSKAAKADHEECEKLRKELARLHKIKDSGVASSADVFIPLAPVGR